MGHSRKTAGQHDSFAILLEERLRASGGMRRVSGPGDLGSWMLRTWQFPFGNVLMAGPPRVAAGRRHVTPIRARPLNAVGEKVDFQARNRGNCWKRYSPSYSPSDRQLASSFWSQVNGAIQGWANGEGGNVTILNSLLPISLG